MEHRADRCSPGLPAPANGDPIALVPSAGRSAGQEHRCERQECPASAFAHGLNLVEVNVVAYVSSC